MRAHKKSTQTNERKAVYARLGSTSGFPRPITLFTRVTSQFCVKTIKLSTKLSLLGIKITGYLMNNLYRALISLATVFPLSITFSYLYADWLLDSLPECGANLIEEHFPPRLFFVFCACALNFILGKIILSYLEYVAKGLDRHPIKINSIKELGTDSLLAYLPYVLPLFIDQGEHQEPMGWLLGAVLLLILSWASMTIAFSPLLRICGMRFFEATLPDGITVTVLIRDPRLRPLKLREASTISESCLYGLK